MIASPLEEVHVRRIAKSFADRIDLIYEPDLLPPCRYVADHKGDPAWRRGPEQQRRWRTLLRRAEVLWDFPVGETSPLPELVPDLRWIQTTSAGVGPLVHQLRLIETEVIVTTASGIHAGPLAEFVFAILLFHTKQLARLETLRKTHHWERFCAPELHGKTMAIVGVGRIGREIARLARAFGMTTWGTVRQPDPARAQALGLDRLFGRYQFADMLSGADCVVVCAPQTADTDGMIGRTEIEALKPGVVFINIGRGTLVDEAALVDGLRSGRIGFAGLDVFRTEPLPPDSPFWDLENVLVNPHSASTADTENAKLTDRFIANLGHYLAGNYAGMAPQFDKLAGY
jgi:phosphoglycerate dehydrogenase-like enzyme